MKKSVVGKLGTLAACLCVSFFWGSDAGGAAPVRQLWYLEQIVEPPEPTAWRDLRFQLGSTGTLYNDAASGQVSAVIDFYLLEMRVAAAQRYFFATTPDGVTLRDTLGNPHRNLVLEIARYHASPKGVHGRISVALLPFDTQLLWKLGVSTGLFATAQVPWELRFSGTLIFSFNRQSDYLFIKMQAGRVWEMGRLGRLRLGGFTAFGEKLLRTPVAGEYQLFELGPEVEYLSPVGRFAVALPMRVWMDRAYSGTTLGYLSDFSPPTLTFGWHLVF